MSRRPKDIGTAAETDVVRYLQNHGWPHAERRALAGALDKGDIAGTPGICWEVKARKKPAGDEQIAAWMVETETERGNALAEVGILVVRRPGYSRARAGSWWAYLSVTDVSRLLALTEDIDYVGDGGPWNTVPARMLLADVVALLRAAGYGTRPEVAS